MLEHIIINVSWGHNPVQADQTGACVTAALARRLLHQIQSHLDALYAASMVDLVSLPLAAPLVPSRVKPAAKLLHLTSTGSQRAFLASQLALLRHHETCQSLLFFISWMALLNCYPLKDIMKFSCTIYINIILFVKVKSQKSDFEDRRAWWVKIFIGGLCIHHKLTLMYSIMNAWLVKISTFRMQDHNGH